ncbi:hypothetical protein [Bhargavaea ginsengi]|uniref:hypothetical protein n=1 Tax=Bhargavaea ginsengi TaxID=426757 RepID=UPI003C72366C
MKQYEIDGLNYKVKTIEMFLGVEITDSTIEGKKAFVDRYRKKRLTESDEALREAYEESKTEQ